MTAADLIKRLEAIPPGAQATQANCHVRDFSVRDIGWAMGKIKARLKVARPGWSRDSEWLVLQDVRGNGIPQVCMKTHNAGTLAWVPRTEDLLADDWLVIA